ncbi:hypothetical protein EDC01DRAFT_661427 [Geopyxis carbonaria]|nr:hypothetical protein EDC01DRAFT_661427 [Geopyxis carbonaria]
MSFELTFLAPSGTGHFLSTPTSYHWSPSLPTPVSQRLLKSHPSDASPLSTLFHLATSPSNAAAYFLAWRDTAGGVWTESAGLPAPLLAWLKDPARSHLADTIHIALSPKPERFFAVSSAGHQWGHVPPELPGHVEAMKLNAGMWRENQTPAGVSWGVGDSYVILCRGGAHVVCSADIATLYPDFRQDLAEKFKAGRHYSYIALNPMVAGQYCVVWKDPVEVGWKVPGDMGALVKEKADEFIANVEARKKVSSATDIALLNQATRLAEQGMQRSAESIARMGDIGTGWTTTYRRYPGSWDSYI